MALLPSPGSKDLHYFLEVLLLPVPPGHCPSCLCQARVSDAPWAQNNPLHSLPPSSLYCPFFLSLGNWSWQVWFHRFTSGRMESTMTSGSDSTHGFSCARAVTCHRCCWSTAALGWQRACWQKPGWGPGRGGGGELQLGKEREAATSASLNLFVNPHYTHLSSKFSNPHNCAETVLEKQPAFFIHWENAAALPPSFCRSVLVCF